MVIGAHIVCSYVKDAIGIDSESHLHLRITSRSRRKSFEAKKPQRFVVIEAVGFASAALDFYHLLVASCSGKQFAALNGNRRVSIENTFGIATRSCNTQSG